MQISVAAVNVAGGCALPDFPRERGDERNRIIDKGGEDRVTRRKPTLLSSHCPAVLLLSRLSAARGSFVTTPPAVAERRARSLGAPGGSRAGGRRA